MDKNDINTEFKGLTKRVGDEPDAEKSTLILTNGIADLLGRLKVGSAYNPTLVDDFVAQIRTHAPMWAQSVATVYGKQPQGR